MVTSIWYANRDAFEHVHLMTVLAGLVNRDQPQLYLLYNDSDVTWLTYMRSAGQWLNTTTIVPNSPLISLLMQFQSYYKGVVVYDSAVAATSNVASTIAGNPPDLLQSKRMIMDDIICARDRYREFITSVLSSRSQHAFYDVN
jgi:hypothetical protein